MMRQFAGLGGDTAPDTPPGQAQELIYRAFDEQNPRRRVELAREALRLCPDCADAHVLLAEHAATRKEALAQYELGVAAGERAIGPDGFRDAAGHFWGVLETRPYMRARLGLAHALWTAGKRDAGVGHLRDMLRLNPNDNQGVRYTLAGFLLFLDRDAELAQLLDQYRDDGSATWAYTAALLAFRRHGDTPDARKLLQQAIRTNRHVTTYLLDAKFPDEPPDYISPGGESEALEYVNGFLAGWKSTAGAVAWVRAATAKPGRAQKSKGPGAATKKLLLKLAKTDDVWQCDARPLPAWTLAGNQPVRPSAILIVNPLAQVLGHEISEEAPTPESVWDVLAAAMRRPLAGAVGRPAAVRVRPGTPGESLRVHLEEIGVAVEVSDKLDAFDAAFASLAGHLGRDDRPGLLEVPGMTPERVRAFYDAAAGFFRRAPWKRVGYEAAIRIESERLKNRPRFAVLMGQSGLTTGLALYDDLAAVRRALGGEADDEKSARETVATSVTFNEAWDISTADLDAAAAHGWPVARPDAYPEVFRKERGMVLNPPKPGELELVEGCLRAVPEFVERHTQDDSTREEFKVPTAGGELKLNLSWVGETEGASPVSGGRT
jgi:tetratricopeptide (TPR) repeat protein